jgi:ParB-like chromosome segregation protein Spo0J
MEFEVKRIADMNRAAYNPRVDLQPEDEEYQAIERSLKRHGLVQPIVWNRRTNTVVSGHQRLTVLEAQGETEVTVSVVDLDDIQEKELNVALNKITGEWDDDKLSVILNELNVALNKITGEWDDDKLSVILNELGEEATDTGFTLPEIDVLRDELKSYFDDVTAPDEEEPTEEPEESFLLSLTFDAADEKPLKAYIKEHSEDAVVRIIVDTVTASA